MEYFVYCRDKPGTGALRAELTEAHWSFMDLYVDTLIARGPTLTEDRETATGSMHIVDVGLRERRARRPALPGIGHGRPGTSARSDELVETQRRYFVDGYLEHAIACGPLLSDDGREWAGTAMLVELPNRPAIEAMLASAPYVQAGLYSSPEVLDWQFGGRT